MSRTTKKSKGYPYNILPLDPPPKDYSCLSPEVVNKYFHIEAILRSKNAEQAYRHSQNKFRLLLREYGINCDPLAGEHHVLMRANKGPESLNDDLASAGFVRNHKTGTVEGDILDLPTVVRLSPSKWWPKGGEVEILNGLRSPLPRFVYIRLDASMTPSAIIHNLRPFLEDRHEQYLRSDPSNPLEQWHRDNMKPVFRDVAAWIKYFQCYDLRRYDQIPYGQIALKIYGTRGARERAEKAILRVERVIAEAVTKHWPPRNPSR